MESEESRFENRFWEIDFMRGVAIIMMVSYHSAFTLYYFDAFSIEVNKGYWRILGRSTAIIFILLVGISLTLSYSKTKHFKSKKEMWVKYILRGVKIISWGLLITLITFIFLKEDYVRFGILHFIGLSIILGFPLIRYKIINLIIGSASILIGFYLESISISSSLLIWVGIHPNSFYTIDYFPLFPWFGLILFGIFLGNILYGGYKRAFNLPDLSNVSLVKFFTFMGRNSLILYLLHIPFIIIVMVLFGIIDISVFL